MRSECDALLPQYLAGVVDGIGEAAVPNERAEPYSGCGPKDGAARATAFGGIADVQSTEREGSVSGNGKDRLNDQCGRIAKRN